MSFSKDSSLSYNSILFEELSNTIYLIRSTNSYFLILNLIFNMTLSHFLHLGLPSSLHSS
jgi:hypothetical protein